MKLAKRLGYKLIIVLCIIATFCSFIASTPVHASKVNKTDFYYSGTSKGSYSVNKGLLETIIETLEAILDYLLGLMTMGVRMVFVGWTALFERCLTLIIKGLSGDDVEVDGVSATGLFSADEGWITLDAIFFNHVPLLDINFFRFEPIEGYDNLGYELADAEGTPVQGETNPENASKKSLIVVFKELIAGWYYSLRLISVMVMLIMLMYIGIQMAIKSIATDKAVYKKMLADWVVGMILVFCIHFIMLFAINFNELLVEQISKLRSGVTNLAVYEYGLKERAKPIENDELELTLYDEVKTRAYDLKMTVGMTGMIMYMVLVYYAWKFTFIYLKRYLTVAVLVIMAPIVAASYAYNKVRSGKAQILSRWFKEFAFIVLLQSIHALMYVTFMQTALTLSLGSISSFILALMLMNFMCKAEGIFRKIFGIGKQGAGLLDEIAGGPGLRDTLRAAKNIVAAKEIKKFAIGYTKGVASLMTKPARMVGGAAFKGHMTRKAEKLDEVAKKYAEDTGNTSIKNYSDYKKFMRKRKTQANEIGSMIKQLESGELDIDLMQKYVDSLEEGDSITDINGNIVGVVDADYKAEQQAKVDELRRVSNFSPEEKQEWLEDYNKLYNRKGQLKGLSIYLSEKWEDIFDPSVYTEAVTDDDGNTTYKPIKTERKNFRKLDSVGKRLSKRLNLKNIANISEEEKKYLEQQAELAKNGIFGFAGILFGLPLLVAEPKAGMVAMSVGLSNTAKLLDGKGSSYRRGISGFSIDTQGNYSFNRFEGGSTKTMARGAKVMAQEQVSEITREHMNQDMSMVRRLEKKHPKLAEHLSRKTKLVAGARFTGKVLSSGRIHDNVWMRYQESMRVINKANKKDYEKRLEKAGMDDYDDFMDVLAERYFEMEHDEFHEDAKRHAEEFESEYQATLLAMELAVEEKTSQELLRDNGYDVPIEGEIEGHGDTLKMSGDAEDKLIERALITFAIQTGTMDISKIVVDDKMDQIENIMKTDLITRGLADKNTDIKKVIDGLNSKVKDTQVKIVKDKRHESSVEERLAGDAIVSLMKEKGVSDPSQVSDFDVVEKYAKMYQDRTEATTKSSKQSNTVLEQLNAQRPEQSGDEAPKAFDIDKIKANATGAIQARRASFTDMAKKSMDTKVADGLREIIKRKQKFELDTQILEHEEKLKQAEETAPKGTDDIINMLNVQTKLYQDKKQMEMVGAKMGKAARDERLKMYMEISEKRTETPSDGSRRIDRTADGSRQVKGVRREAPPVALDVTEIIKNLERQ